MGDAGLGPLTARRRGDVLRATAIDMIATADNLIAAQARVSELEAENQRLRREMATAMATRPPVAAERAAVPPPGRAEGETPAPDASVLQARPTRGPQEPCDEFAARCYLHGYRVGHAAGERFVVWKAEQWSVSQVTPAGVLRAAFEPAAPTTEAGPERPGWDKDAFQ